MSKLFIVVMGFMFSFAGTAKASKTLYQCAVDQVKNGGVRVNVIEKDGKIRANLIFGTTVSGTIYNVEKTKYGYSGQIKNKPGLMMELSISKKTDRNSNIEGFASYLIVTYPNLNSREGFSAIETEMVCGEKISDRWN